MLKLCLCLGLQPAATFESVPCVTERQRTQNREPALPLLPPALGLRVAL
jgi:hypothetical protein